MSDEAGCEQFPEISIVTRAGGRDDDNITRLCQFDSNMQRPIISRSNLTGQCVPCDMSRSKNGSEARCQQPDPTLGLMDCRDTNRCERVNHLERGTWGAAHYNCHETPLTYLVLAPSD